MCSALLIGALLIGALLFGAVFVNSAVADDVVDRLRRSAQDGEITKVEFADSLLALGEVNHAAIENPEVLMLRFPGFADIIGQRLVERVNKHVIDGKKDEISQLTFLAERMLGTSSSYTQAVQRAIELQKKYDELVSRGTVDTAAAFRAGLSTPEEKELYAPKLEQFMKQTISQRMNRGAPFMGLKNMASLGKISQPPALVTAVKELLNIIIEQAKSNKIVWASSTLEEVRVDKLLSDLQKTDASFSNQLVEIYSLRAKAMAGSGSYDEVLTSLKQVVARRADPNEANTNLRREILFSLSGEAADGLAQSLIADLKSADALSFGDKTDLYFAGYYGKGTLLTMILLFVFLLIASVAGVYFLGKKVPELSPDSIFGRMQEAKRRRMIKKNEKRGVGYTSVVEHEDVYSKLLAEFGLDDTASESDIKKAYRQMVKEHHPDAHGAAGRVVTEDGKTDRSFEDLKKNYNRLMEMRKSFFSG